MKVLGVCTYPVEAAATRYRLKQFIEPLADRGIDLTVSPFLDSRNFEALYRQGNSLKKIFSMLEPLKNRIFEGFSINKFNVLLVQREAMMFGPAIFEFLAGTVGKCPIVLDLDDATYIRYVSPTYGRLGSALKFFGKTDALINRAETVICGNRFIAEYVEKKGVKTSIVPTVVDTDKFCPVEKKTDEMPVIGWIGTSSTFPFVVSLFPVLQKLAEKYDFVLKIVGAGEKVELEGVKVDNSEWNLDREINDFQMLDIGLYPLKTTDSANSEWLFGKSGFKAIQYMSIGIPFVVTPIGCCAEIGIETETHFAASTNEQWFRALENLLQSGETRRKMGEQGRKYALAHFTVPQQADKIAAVLDEAHKNFRKKRFS